MQPQTCDTSVLIPALLPWHEHHETARSALGSDLPALPAHVLIETYSVLTRLPAPHRLSATVVVEALTAISGRLLTLAPDRYLSTIKGLAAGGVKGGAVYDGIIAATALQHSRVLLTFDRRALKTYEIVGSDVRLL
jgi:predicted nucleic acid-binding protein